MIRKICFVFFLISTATTTNCYLNVLVIPGIFSPPGGLQVVCDGIQQLHPATNCTLIQPQNGSTSAIGILGLVQLYLNLVLPHFKANPDGIHLVCHSQGTLICRYIIESTSDHPVKSYVSLAGPQMGEYGIPDFNTDPLHINELIKDNNNMPSALFIYSLAAQTTISVAGYWKDPYNIELYKIGSLFLAPMNNEVNHSKSVNFKQNFLRLNVCVLVGSPEDGVIKPWQSTQMEFYNENENGTIIPLNNSETYIDDLFGIGTMDKTNRLFRYILPNVTHSNTYAFEYLRDVVVQYLP